MVYAAQPREGTETSLLRSTFQRDGSTRFMQLNPARGRKLQEGCDSVFKRLGGLCSSTPRGDGNLQQLQGSLEANVGPGLCSSTPRGDGNSVITGVPPSNRTRFMQLNPARGRKRLWVSLLSLLVARFMQLNPARERKPIESVYHVLASAHVVYAAQPREGTETTSPTISR